VVTHGAKFNFGPSGPSGLHAPSATPDGKGGLIVIFNMNPGKPTPRWNQIMTLPRRVTVDGDAVFIEPVETLTSLRQAEQDLGSLSLAANQEVVLDGTSGEALELELEVEPSSAPMFELNVLRSPNREEFTRVAFYRDRGYRTNHFTQGLVGPLWTHLSQISIDTSYSSIAPDALSRAPENAQVLIAPDEPLRLRVFVDRSAVEVFANGRQALAVRVYPEREDSLGVSLRSQGAPSTVRSLKAWTLESLWD
jgi:beta-fructofuranosidase